MDSAQSFSLFFFVRFTLPIKVQTSINEQHTRRKQEIVKGKKVPSEKRARQETRFSFSRLMRILCGSPPNQPTFAKWSFFSFPSAIHLCWRRYQLFSLFLYSFVSLPLHVCHSCWLFWCLFFLCHKNCVFAFFGKISPFGYGFCFSLLLFLFSKIIFKFYSFLNFIHF